MAKEKEVSGVKDEPKEGSAEGRDDIEASRQPAQNGFSNRDPHPKKEADAEPAGKNPEARAAAGGAHFCLNVSLHILQRPHHPCHYKSYTELLAAHIQWLPFGMAAASDRGGPQTMRT